MGLFHKIKKYYVSDIDFFIKKTAEKKLTKSQQINLDKANKISNARDNIVHEDKQDSMWD
ncbi:MAG: hypothetical protein HON78_05455 [Legionellales bacterium]|jgi:hypothetical protein|nr:hypothetical protein [Legionellales bacterium]